MSRTQLAIIGVLVMAIVTAIVWRAHQQSTAPEEPHSTQVASANASAAATQPSAEILQPAPAASVETTLPDGRKVPELPADAPKSVTFAVVLFTYRGAENAPTDARDKAAALAKAKELLPEAVRDFDEAVKKGDPGSTARAGTMPRDVLEPGFEYVLFTLKKGEVYGEPVDTPRGYWILKRTE